MNKQTSSNPKQKSGLSGTLRHFFGIGDAGFTLMTSLEAFYFMSFLTDLAGFSAMIAAAINSVFSVVDACLSWVYGGILTGSRARKWGRYRSWLILVPWIVPFIYAFQFLRIGDNEILAAVIVVTAAIVSHVIWNIAYVANVTMISVVAKTPDDKAAMSSSRATWQGIGSLLFSYLGLPFATVLAGVVGEKNQFAAVAFCLGCIMALGYFAHFKMTEGYELPETGDQKKAQAGQLSVPDMFRSLFQNPQLMVLMLVDLAKWVVNFVSAGAAIYYFRDAVSRPELMVSYTLLISLGSILGSYCMQFMAKRFSSRTAMILAYAGMTASLLGVYFGYASPYLVIGLMSLARLFLGMANAAAPALYADTVVYATWKTGRNAAGWIMGLQNLPLKIAVFLRGVIIGACLTAVGWQSGAVLEGTARQGMTVGFGLVPALFCLAGLLLMVFFYRLTKEKVMEYQAEIDAREA